MSQVPFSFLPSPFFNHRPPGTVIDLLVIHAISLPPGCFGGTGINDLFLGKLYGREIEMETDPLMKELTTLRVSVHFLIDRLGKVTQYVPIFFRAWHAGQSTWQGRRACNDFSVGIELEGDTKTPFEPVQYQRLASLTGSLQEGLVQQGHGGFTKEQIAGHQHIAPERKWDPGPFFDWKLFHAVLDQTKSLPKWPLVWR